MAAGIVRTLAAVVLAFGLIGPASASQQKVNVGDGGIAIDGYDPVAYFELGKPVQGSSSYEATVDGVTYRFASLRHLDLFRGAPAKYTPAYGGYCSYGMRFGQTSRIDPTAWKIVDGKLYLQFNQGTQAVWLDKVAENITIADQQWERFASGR